MAGVPQPNEDDAVIEFHGRWFAEFSLQTGTHCIPVDEREEQKSDLLNKIFREIFGGSVIPHSFPPPGVDGPTVLDCGFGKGAWIDDLLGEYEDCEVTGIDIFLGRGNGDADDDESSGDEGGDEVQEFVKKRWNLNAPFRQDPSDDRLRPETFDLVNSRLLAEGIDADRWPSYIRDLRNVLRPGGWLQMIELHMLPQSDNGTLNDNHCLRQWYQRYGDSMEQRRKDPRISHRLHSLMIEQGFEHVRARPYNLQVGGWDERFASLGDDFLQVMDDMLESRTLVPFLSSMQMEPARYRALLRGARQELRTSGLKVYFKMYVVVGRRPPRRR